MLLVELLEADKVDLRNRGALLDSDDDDTAIDFNANVLEETGREKRLDCLSRLFVGHGVTDLDRKIAEHRSGFGSLNSVYTNILDCKGFKCGCAGSNERGDHARKQFFLHSFSRKSID